MFLTQDGLGALADFTISAASKYDVDGRRVEGNDGVKLTCTLIHEDKSEFQWHWPGHVAAPTLRDLALVAERHWSQNHRASSTESVQATA